MSSPLTPLVLDAIPEEWYQVSLYLQYHQPKSAYVWPQYQYQ